MTKPWQLVALFQLELIKMTTQSIAGVTYMDHFDFEERYRDVYECDPFYWHPLHLPEHCAEMYEKLIRTKIASRAPVRIVKEKQDVGYELNIHNNFYNPYVYETQGFEVPFIAYKKLTPYEKMFAYLKSDITKHPKAPTIEMMPNFGPVAVYRQPISKRSEIMIKQIAEAYAKVQPSYGDSGQFFGHIDVKDGQAKNNNDKIEFITNSNDNNKPVKITKKLKNGDIVTITKKSHK